MKYRRLGSTELRVSVIGVGTWQLGGEWGKDFSREEVDAMFDAARGVGINLIDTAECYGDHTSEALIGGAIARDRGNWIVATKFGHRYEGHMKRSEPRAPADILQQLERSLRALRTDYVDLLQFHSWGNDQFDNPEVWATLEDIQKSGKARHIGNSIGASDNVHQVEESHAAHVEVIQVRYNRLERTAESAVLSACARLNLGVLTRVPLASGFLSGKYKPGHASFPPNDVRAGMSREQLDAKLREVEQIQNTEVPRGENMAEWALAWCLKNEAVSAVIPGCKNVAQVESNAHAAELDLVKDDHPHAWK